MLHQSRIQSLGEQLTQRPYQQGCRKVSLWLGHANLATTEIYTRADPSEKLEAINAIVPPHLRKGKFRPPDKLIALLKDKSNGEEKRARAY
jgi:hypothetical protein